MLREAWVLSELVEEVLRWDLRPPAAHPSYGTRRTTVLSGGQQYSSSQRKPRNHDTPPTTRR